MTSTNLWTGVRTFAELLLKGQRVDWKYSLVVTLVITGMFSTPLVLGSIRNRVYVAVKEQIEKENNAREVSLQMTRDDAVALDEELIAAVESQLPDVRAVGNHKLVLSIEGPQGADFLTLQTLSAEDPRQDPLRITPRLPADFGLTDLVVSDALGLLLYGDAWREMWDDEDRFHGPPLTLRINELPMTVDFRVVARRLLPGRGLHGSQALGAALRRYTLGFGSSELGLPVDEGLVAHALPRLAVASCLLLLNPTDATCDESGRESLQRRLRELQLEVAVAAMPGFPLAESFEAWQVSLSELVEDGEGRLTRKEIRADCSETLVPHLVDRCPSAIALPELTVDVALERAGEAQPVTVVAVPRAAWPALAGNRELTDRQGVVPPSSDGAVGLAVAARAAFELAEEVDLLWQDERVPARVEGFYDCTGESCPVLAAPLATFRLRNLQEGSVKVFSRDPLTFVPVRSDVEYDEILVYAGQVEDVEAVSHRLRELYPGLKAQYNVTALDKLRRQNSRLSTLFTITITLSALFIVLALGALASINVERRSRQVAQMLILGFSRGFVRRLIVAEHLFLTILSAVSAFAITALLCAAARRFLSAGIKSTERGFEVIVQSMTVDPAAFFHVLVVVTVCTWMVAFVSARKAAQTDPLNLLD